MSSATPAEAAPAVDPDGRPVEVSRRRQGRREAGGVGVFGQGADLLVRVVQLVVSVVVLVIVAGRKATASAPAAGLRFLAQRGTPVAWR
jgi:hypothetical protein